MVKTKARRAGAEEKPARPLVRLRLAHPLWNSRVPPFTWAESACNPRGGPIGAPCMRILASLLLLICSVATMLASAGAPPFTNGSPLVSGVDGSYQATARGKNLLGVFRFTYSTGVQTSSPRLPTGNSVPNLLTDPYNDYVFFVEGKTFRGLVQANINISSIAGVLDNGASNVFNAGASVSPTPTASPT